MVNQQLLDYVKQQIEQGITFSAIKESLITSGWKEVDINEVFTTLTPAAPAVQVLTPPISTAPQSETIPYKKKKWIKGIVITIVSLVVLNYTFFYLPHVLNIFTKDIPPPEYSDLKLEKIVIADSDNAYFDLQKIENVLYYPEEASTTITDMASGKNWNDNLAEEMVSKNTQTFEYLKQALNKPKFQYPQFADPETISAKSLPTSDYSRKIAKLESIKILYLLKQNKNEEAFNEAFLLLSFGQKIGNSQGNLLNYLIAVSIKNMAIEDIQKIINVSDFTSEELKRYSNNLNEYKNDNQNLATTLKIENYYLINNFTNLSKDINSGLKNTNLPFNSKREEANAVYYFKIEKIKQIIIDDTRNKITFLNEPYSKEFPENENFLIFNNEKGILLTLAFIKGYFTENFVGKLLLGAVQGPYSQTRRRSVELPIGATQLIMSIRAFKNDTSTLPNNLNELVPKYISSIPLDPYDKQPLRYSKEKKIIYSVGTSTEDVGGSDGSSWQMKNPTFKFDF